MLFPQVLGQLLDWRFAQRANAMFAVSQRHANIRLNSSESNSRMRLSDCRGPYIEVPPQRRGSVHSSQIDFFSPNLYTKMFAINFSTRCKKRFENGHVWEELDRFSKTHYGGTSGTLAKPWGRSKDDVFSSQIDFFSHALYTKMLAVYLDQCTALSVRDTFDNWEGNSRVSQVSTVRSLKRPLTDFGSFNPCTAMFMRDTWWIIGPLEVNPTV